MVRASNDRVDQSVVGTFIYIHIYHLFAYSPDKTNIVKFGLRSNIIICVLEPKKCGCRILPISRERT